MMSDQADNLRKLVHVSSEVAPAAVGGAPMIAVTGCRAGVGATTVAVNLAAVLADRGLRVLLVDADEERSNLAEAAGLRAACEFTLADALAGRCDIAESLATGPAGIKILSGGLRAVSSPGGNAARVVVDRRDALGGMQKAMSPVGHKELLGALKLLRGKFDLIVVDTGAGLSRTARRLWLRAQLAMLVTTSDDAAVMDAYAAVKLHIHGARDATCENLRVLVNKVESDRMAADAFRRLTNCCQRFLRQSVAALPALPWFGDREDAGANLRPRVWELADSPFGHAALWLGRAVGDVLDTCKPMVGERGAGSGERGARSEGLGARS